MDEENQGFMSKIMGVLGPLLPLILALVAGFFLFRKFFQHETVETTPETPEKPNNPNAPNKSGQQILEAYADQSKEGNRNGKLDGAEKDFLKKKLGKIFHKDGSALSDLEFSFVPEQMNGEHKAKIDNVLLKSLEGGKLSDKGFDAAANRISQVVTGKSIGAERH